MPNWCNNNITIEGPADKIQALYKAAVDDDGGLLNAMVPTPERLHDAVSNWGTKWDVSPEGLKFIDNGNGRAMITGWFDSAWAPPIQAYMTFEEENEDCSVEASYYEMGCDFAGFYTNGNDEYMEGLQEEVQLPEEEQSELFKRLDEEFDLSSKFAEWDEYYVDEPNNIDGDF